jgi:hypothetical protein
MQTNFSKEFINYYLDECQREILDRSPVYRRGAEFLSLRQQLINLPEESFETTVNNIRTMLNAKSSSAPLRRSEEQILRKEAFSTLFPRVGTSSGVGSSTVSQAAATGKV